MPTVCNGREVVDSTTSSLWKAHETIPLSNILLLKAVYSSAHPHPTLPSTSSNMLQRDNSVWVDWLTDWRTVARVTLTVKAKWCSYSEQYVSIVKPFCIDLICCDLVGLQIDVIKCTVPCPKESCCQMGACEAIVLYKNKRLFLSCPYSAVNISKCCRHWPKKKKKKKCYEIKLALLLNKMCD